MQVLKKLAENKIQISVTANDDVFLTGDIPNDLLNEAKLNKQEILRVVKPAVFPEQNNDSAVKTKHILEGIEVVYITKDGSEEIAYLQSKPMLGLDIETMPKGG